MVSRHRASCSSRGRLAIVILATLVATLMGPPQRALPCSCGFPELAAIFPTAGMIDVPLDTLIWLDNPEARWPIYGELSWQGGATDLITVDLGLDDLTLVMRPRTPLPPDTELRLEARPGGESEFDTLELTFRTGSHLAADAAAPRVPALRDASYEAVGGCGGTCGPSEHYRLELGSASPGIVLATTAQPSEAGAGLEDVAIVDAKATSGPSNRVVLRVGDRGCARSNLDLRGDTRLRFGLADASGRFSGWSGAEDIESGCGSGGAGHGVVAALALMLARAAAGSRRRRSPERA